MARAKYLTDEQLKDIESDLDALRRMRAVGDALSKTGSWGDVRVILTYLHGNEAGTGRFRNALVASAIGTRGVSGEDLHSSFVDDRAFRHGVRDGNKTIGTRDVLRAVKSLRAEFPARWSHVAGKAVRNPSKGTRRKRSAAAIAKLDARQFGTDRTTRRGKAWKRGVKKAMRKAKQSKGTYARKTPRLGTRRKNPMRLARLKVLLGGAHGVFPSAEDKALVRSLGGVERRSGVFEVPVSEGVAQVSWDSQSSRVIGGRGVLGRWVCEVRRKNAVGTRRKNPATVWYVTADREFVSENWRGKREKTTERLFTNFKVYGGTAKAAADYALVKHGLSVTRERLGTSYVTRVRKSAGTGKGRK